MIRAVFIVNVLLATCVPGAASSHCLAAETPAGDGATVRVATYNVSLYRRRNGQLQRDLARGRNQQAWKLAHVIRTVRPDVLLLNEFDFDSELNAARSFRDRYLAGDPPNNQPGGGSDGTQPIEYPYMYAADVNTGEDSGLDLDQDGKLGGGGDAFGFGVHPGQYGMLVLSRYPIRQQQVRSFRKFLWRDMPQALLPRQPQSGEPFYPEPIERVFRLSSKSHWDVPIQIGESTLHLLASHPTPPVFDGPEDRNGRRNHDEIRLLADYVSPAKSKYIYDDQGARGGLSDGSLFVIAGDLNADPNDGASYQHAARQLTKHPLINDARPPHGAGGLQAADQGVNSQHKGPPAVDTADFDDRRTGNLRVDYVLPSRTLTLIRSGVFWPGAKKVGNEWISASDHRLVWIDVQVPNRD